MSNHEGGMATDARRSRQPPENADFPSEVSISKIRLQLVALGVRLVIKHSDCHLHVQRVSQRHDLGAGERLHRPQEDAVAGLRLRYGSSAVLRAIKVDRRRRRFEGVWWPVQPQRG